MIRSKAPRILFIAIAALTLAACDPAHETTASQCANGENSSVTIGLDTSSGNVFETPASREPKEYQLYLQDILEAAEPDDSVVLTADQQLALDNIRQQINGNAEDEFNLQYELTDGAVTQATNPLDYIEYLMASQDEDLVIGAFEEAREQIERGISSDDDFCIYSNRNIRFVDEDSEDLLFAELNLSYDPFSQIVQQSFLIAELREDLSSSVSRQSVPYFGFSQADRDDFDDRGFYPVILRQALMNSPDGEHSLIIDDGNDNSLGQIEITTQNTFCTDEDDEVVACDGAITTRVPQKAQCSAEDPDNEYSADENGLVQVRSMRLNDTFTDLKRIRLETDYAEQEVRIYVSEYNEAIYDSDGVTIIQDPTNCEKQAVLQELSDLNPGEGVRLTVVDDPNYDILYDDDGNITTTPAYTYTGTLIPSRAGD